MKKKYLCLAAFVAATSSPVALTSCSEDEINTALQIIELFINTNELANTAWVTSDYTFGIEFSSNNTGNLYDGSSTPIPFSYVLDTTNNTLTLTFSDNSQEVMTVASYEANKVLQLVRANGKTITLYPLTDDEEE